MSTALAIAEPSNADLYRQSTDAAGLCKEIVLKTAMEIQNRKYVKVEGWQAIAIAHGCTGSACAVERVEGGVRAIGQVRRMSDGSTIAEAEGFVGEDEAVWFGGETSYWDKQKRERVTKQLPKRPDYAIRAMAQTRAISRACRSAFAHVVVLMDAGLSTTPAEEVPDGGFNDEPAGNMRNVTNLRTVPQEKTLAQLADDFEAGLKACRTQADLVKLDKTLGSQLGPKLAAADPARDAQIGKLYGETEARLASADPQEIFA